MLTCLLDLSGEDPDTKQYLDHLIEILRHPDLNLGGRSAPKPANMVKPTFRSGRSYYVVTTGRVVGITRLL